MEKKNLVEQTTPSSESPSVPLLATLPDQQEQITELREEIHSLMTLIENKQGQSVAPQVQQIADLREEMRSLVTLVQTQQGTGLRNSIFDNTMAEIKDIKALVKNMLISPRSMTNLSENEQECNGEGPYGFICGDYCCFEIVLDKVRATQPQGLPEPLDSGDTNPPVPAPGAVSVNELDVRIFASIDNVGILIPSLNSTMGLRVPSLLGGGGPGLWVSINQVIGRVYLKKGTTRTINIEFQGQESDEGLESFPDAKSEYGFAMGSITLDCCTTKIYPPMPTDLSFNYGGSGGIPPLAAPGMISLAFYARRVCC